MNAYVWCWKTACGSLDEIPSVTMGTCKRKFLINSHMTLTVLNLHQQTDPKVQQDFKGQYSKVKGQSVLHQCFRLRTNVRKFTPKSSDLRTYYLPGGQTDAEVFVERNIDISSIYEAILYLFQFQNKNGRFPAVYLSLRMRGIKRSRGEEFARLRGHSCAFGLFN